MSITAMNSMAPVPETSAASSATAKNAASGSSTEFPEAKLFAAFLEQFQQSTNHAASGSTGMNTTVAKATNEADICCNNSGEDSETKESEKSEDSLSTAIAAGMNTTVAKAINEAAIWYNDSGEDSETKESEKTEGSISAAIPAALPQCVAISLPKLSFEVASSGMDEKPGEDIGASSQGACESANSSAATAASIQAQPKWSVPLSSAFGGASEPTPVPAPHARQIELAPPHRTLPVETVEAVPAAEANSVNQSDNLERNQPAWDSPTDPSKSASKALTTPEELDRFLSLHEFLTRSSSGAISKRAEFSPLTPNTGSRHLTSISQEAFPAAPAVSPTFQAKATGTSSLTPPLSLVDARNTGAVLPDLRSNSAQGASSSSFAGETELSGLDSLVAPAKETTISTATNLGAERTMPHPERMYSVPPQAEGSLVVNPAAVWPKETPGLASSSVPAWRAELAAAETTNIPSAGHAEALPMKNVTAKPMPSADNSSGVPKERILSNPHAGLQSMDPATGSAEVTQTSTPLPSVQTIPQSQSSREFQNVLLKQGQENMPQSSGMQTVAEIPVADSAILDRFTPPLAASFQERRFHPVREVEVHYDMAMKVAENANSNIAAAFNDVRSFRNPTTVELNALSSVTPWSWNRPAATPETQIPSEATVSANPKSQPASVPTSSDSSAQTATGQTPNRSQAANSVFPTPGARQSTEADLAVPQRYLHPAMVPGSTTVAAFEGTSSPSNALGGNSAMSPMASLSAEVMVQVIEHGKLLRSRNLDEVTLQLKPEILGKVAIKASLENGQLSTRISVENIQIAQFLSDHANWLRNSMGPVEIQVVSFDHSNASLPAPSFNYNGSSQGDVPAHRGIQPRRRAGTQRTTEPESVTEAATVPSSTRLDLHL